MEERSVKIGGNAVGNVIATGDANKIDATANAKMTKAVLPSPNSVDVVDELLKLRAILDTFEGEHRGKVVRALDDAIEEGRKPHPDKDQVGSALGRAIEYAKKGNRFADEVGKLVPHVTQVVAWLGSNWHKLLPLVGLAV
jgi:hypothetical protein